MTNETFKRKLAAILSADAKGYSRLMGQDDVATVRMLKSCQEIMGETIRRHNGRVIDSPGDNLLAEFASVVEAVKAALKIQEELKKHAGEFAKDQRMPFRIGINLGDVIVDEDRLYGDGVNIAARLEGLAEAGGICISGSAYDQVQHKLVFGSEYIGEQQVKNIAAPVKVYKIWTGDRAVANGASSKPRKARSRLWLAVAVIALMVATAGSVYKWRAVPVQKSNLVESRVSQKEVHSFPDKPSIAVLPFSNLSADTDQEYFSDGITNDIITDLTKFRKLSVIASHTVFQFKGKSIDARELGRSLNVRYLLEGSIQKTNGRIRINVQLIDTTNGNHVWADRYDRKAEDIFNLQDDIIQTIVGKLAIKIEAAERSRVMRKDTTSYQAYDYYIRGTGYLIQRTRSANSKAKQLLEKAIEIDPQYASAYTALGWYYDQQVDFGWTEFPGQAYERALGLAQKALSLDDSQISAYELRGNIYTRRAQYDLALVDLQHALELNPNDSRIQLELGDALLYSGQTDEAIKYLEAGLRASPSANPGAYMELGLAYYLKDRYLDAVKILQQGLAKKPDFLGHHIVIAATYARLDRIDEAKNSAQKVMRLHPFFEVDGYGTVFKNPSDREKIIVGLREAGLN
jgi:adenylate cyclase